MESIPEVFHADGACVIKIPLLQDADKDGADNSNADKFNCGPSFRQDTNSPFKIEPAPCDTAHVSKPKNTPCENFVPGPSVAYLAMSTRYVIATSIQLKYKLLVTESQTEFTKTCDFYEHVHIAKNNMKRMLLESMFTSNGIPRSRIHTNEREKKDAPCSKYKSLITSTSNT